MHESDTQTISIPFEVDCLPCDGISDLTTPGLALGVGQRVNINGEASALTLEFDLSNGQYINLSEVVYLVHTIKLFSIKVTSDARESIRTAYKGESIRRRSLVSLPLTRTEGVDLHVVELVCMQPSLSFHSASSFLLTRQRYANQSGRDLRGC